MLGLSHSTAIYWAALVKRDWGGGDYFAERIADAPDDGFVGGCQQRPPVSYDSGVAGMGDDGGDHD